MRICEIEGCETKHYGRGFCYKHYNRWNVNGDPLKAAPRTGHMKLSDRLDFYTDKTGDCWEWQNAKTKGYGVLTHEGRLHYAHRLSWFVHNGDIPTGMCVLHECDNPACINPSHLFIGTHKANMTDRCEKGRTAKGEESGPAKLTEKDVHEIRGLFKSGEKIVDIAIKYNVSESAISYIKSGVNWAWLK